MKVKTERVKVYYRYIEGGTIHAATAYVTGRNTAAARRRACPNGATIDKWEIESEIFDVDENKLYEFLRNNNREEK